MGIQYIKALKRGGTSSGSKRGGYDGRMQEISIYESYDLNRLALHSLSHLLQRPKSCN